MIPDEYDELLRRLASSAERQEAQIERMITIQGIANERLGKAEETLSRMQQQLDRTDATHAGISMTLARLTSTLEAQTAVLTRLETTLDRWVAGQSNGHEGRNG